MVRVAIYARVSTGSEEQANALEQQLDRLDRGATDRGDSDPAKYIDIASGSNDDRPELARLLRDCAAGTINSVVVTRLDRLSRSSIHGAQLLRYFSQDNTPNLIALDDSLDLSTSGGRFMARMLISWAEAESDRLAERTKHGFAHRRNQRKPFGSKPPFGYRFTGERDGLEPDPDWWPVAQEVVARFLESKVAGSVIDWLHDEHGFTWGSPYSFQRWLRNPTLAGARVYGQQVREIDPDTGRKRRVSRPPGEFGEVHWTDDDGRPFQVPLLTREQLALIHSVYEARKQPGTRELNRDTKVLTGLVKCGDCGRNLHHHKPGKGANYWCMRCVTVGCPSRYRNLRARETGVVMMAFLQRHATELVSHLDEIERARNAEMSREESDLRDQIQKLEAMDDPDLQTVLDGKREKLAVMVNRDARGEIDSFLATVREFEELDPGDFLRDEPQAARHLLQRYCHAEAKSGELTYLYVAEQIRRPGHGRAISVEGLGMGKTPAQMLARLKAARRSV